MRNHADIVLNRKDMNISWCCSLQSVTAASLSDALNIRQHSKMPGTDICKQRNRQKNLRRADWRKKTKNGMDTERETEGSVLGANALWERWACHEQLPAWWIRKQVLLQHFPLSQTLSLSLSLSHSLSLWPLEWFATSLLIDNHVGEKPSEAYYRTLRCLRWHFLAGVMTRWH